MIKIKLYNKNILNQIFANLNVLDHLGIQKWERGVIDVWWWQSRVDKYQQQTVSRPSLIVLPATSDRNILFCHCNTNDKVGRLSRRMAIDIDMS